MLKTYNTPVEARKIGITTKLSQRKFRKRKKPAIMRDIGKLRMPGRWVIKEVKFSMLNMKILLMRASSAASKNWMLDFSSLFQIKPLIDCMAQAID